MIEKDDDKLIKNTIKGRSEVYYLVAEKDLNNLKANSLFGDMFFLLASLSLAGYFSKQDYVFLLLFGLIFLAFAVYYYYVKYGFIKDIKSSGEVTSINAEASTKEYKNENEELRIIQATYGTPSKSIDVTKKLNELIQNGKLNTTASNRLAGDPDVGTVKTLEVKYENNGILITKKYNENEAVNLP